MQNDGYAAASRALLEQARHELAAGDSRQASEKLWGAAAQIVKRVAASRGWPHNSHRAFFEALARLVEETGDRDLRTSFQVADSLHANFYENWQPPDAVEGAVPVIEEFVDKMEALLTSPASRA